MVSLSVLSGFDWSYQEAYCKKSIDVVKGFPTEIRLQDIFRILRETILAHYVQHQSRIAIFQVQRFSCLTCIAETVTEFIDYILYEWEYFKNRALREERVQCPTSYTVEIMVNGPNCLARVKWFQFHAKDQNGSGIPTAG